jgi:uncharacterized membrane protein YciS (DUF1049 family)
MRYLSVALIVLFTVAVVFFMGQNLELVTVNFLSLRLTLRLALLVILVYVLGMFSGGMLRSLLRRVVQHATVKT